MTMVVIREPGASGDALGGTGALDRCETCLNRLDIR